MAEEMASRTGVPSFRGPRVRLQATEGPSPTGLVQELEAPWH